MPDVGALLAGITAGVSLLVAIWSLVFDRRRQERDRERTSSLDALSVASTESKASLDFLLRERLGEVNISSYFRDPRVRREADTAFEELENPSVVDPDSLPKPEERTVTFSKAKKWILSNDGSGSPSSHNSLDEALSAARASLASAGLGKIEVREPDGNVVFDRTRPRGARFNVYTDKAGQYRFMLRDASGRPLLVSDGYSSKSAALNAVDSVRRSSDSEIVEVA